MAVLNIYYYFYFIICASVWKYATCVHFLSNQRGWWIFCSWVAWSGNSVPSSVSLKQQQVLLTAEPALPSISHVFNFGSWNWISGLEDVKQIVCVVSPGSLSKNTNKQTNTSHHQQNKTTPKNREKSHFFRVYLHPQWNWTACTALRITSLIHYQHQLSTKRCLVTVDQPIVIHFFFFGSNFKTYMWSVLLIFMAYHSFTLILFSQLPLGF